MHEIESLQHCFNKGKQNRRMGRNDRGRRFTGRGSSKIAKYTVPTPGLENVHFGQGNAFKYAVCELANYVGAMDRPGVNEATYALDSNIYPEHISPEKPDDSCMDKAVYLVYSEENREYNCSLYACMICSLCSITEIQ